MFILFLSSLVVCDDILLKKNLCVVLVDFLRVIVSWFFLIWCNSVWVLVVLSLSRLLKVNINVLMWFVVLWLFFFRVVRKWVLVWWLKLLKILVIILWLLCWDVLVRLDMNFMCSVCFIFFKIFFWMVFMCNMWLMIFSVSFFGKIFKIWVVWLELILESIIVMVCGYLFFR